VEVEKLGAAVLLNPTLPRANAQPPRNVRARIVSLRCSTRASSSVNDHEARPGGNRWRRRSRTLSVSSTQSEPWRPLRKGVHGWFARKERRARSAELSAFSGHVANRCVLAADC